MNVRPWISRPRSGRWAVPALYLATVAVYADMYLTQPILPLFSRDWHVSPATAGLTISVLVLMIALASSSYGPLSDAVGRKRVMVSSCFVLAVPTLLCAFAPNFGVLLLFRALQGLVIPGITAVSVAYLGDRVTGADLGGAVGGLISASVAGGLAGRVLSGIVAGAFSWRASFLVFAAWTICGALAMAYALPPDQARTSPGWVSAYRGMFAHLGNPQQVGAYLIGLTLFFAFIGMFTYLPYYLTAAPYNLPSGLVSSVYIVYLAGVLVAPFAGRLSLRFPRRWIMAAGMTLAAFGAIMTLHHALSVIVIGLVVMVAGNFMAQSTAPAFVNATATSSKGGANALYLAFYYVGATFGSSVPGIAWQRVGWPGVVGICVTSLLLGLVANWLLCGRRGNH
ncbi:MAG: MFS transporter [Herpetosiphon sp.]